MNKKEITEEMNVHTQWYKKAKNQTIETLPAFLKKLTEEYHHDYGTIVHACTAAAIAAIWSVDASPIGGITGFQAGSIMWQFIKQWNKTDNKTGLRLVDFDKMLYPQYDYLFEKTISESTWIALQEQARLNLEEKGIRNSSVVDHWQSIVDGKVPFGYKVSKK